MRAAILLLSLAPALPADAATIAGRVLLPGGKPAAGARVWLAHAGETGARFIEGKADAAGGFRLDLGAARPPVLVLGGAAPGAAPTWKRLRLPAGGTAKAPAASLALSAPVTLAARLIRTDGRGAPGARVTVRAVLPAAGSGLEEHAELLMPPHLVAALYTHSGPDGRFRLAGLPPRAELHLGLPDDLQPAEGTPSTIRLAGPGVQNAGALVVLRPSSLRVLATTSEGAPLPGAPVFLRRAPAPRQHPPDSPFPALDEPGPPVALEVEAGGLAVLEGVLPGRYEVALRGKVAAVEVPEDESVGPVRLAVRAGALRGRVLDARGAPVRGARVTVEIGPAPRDWPPGPAQPAVTGEEGAFVLDQFPWEAGSVVVRAVAGSAAAEWTGSPGELSGGAELRLVDGVLVTVRGRLVGPGGTPASDAQVALFEREGGRPRALAVGKTDGEGRFSLGGLRRGGRFAVGTVIRDVAMESAFHTPPAVGETMDLGDVALMPSRPAGGETDIRPEEIRAALTPLPPLPPAELERARDVAFAFLQAARAGDAAGMHRLTWPLAPSYEADLARYRRSQCMLLPPETAGLTRAGLHALPSIPRVVLLQLFGAAEGREDRARLLAALERPEWVVLGCAGGQGVDVLVVARRGERGWQVAAGLPHAPTAMTAAKGDTALLGQAYPSPPPAPVLAAARAYLAAWTREDLGAMLRLTSPHAREHAAAAAEFRRRWSERPNRGRPPWSAPPTPQPAAGYSRWDVALLLSYPAMRAGALGAGAGGPRTLRQFPFPEVRAGDAAVLRYAADGKRFLMLLARRQGRWEVVEPALEAGHSHP